MTRGKVDYGNLNPFDDIKITKAKEVDARAFFDFMRADSDWRDLVSEHLLKELDAIQWESMGSYAKWNMWLTYSWMKKKGLKFDGKAG